MPQPTIYQILASPTQLQVALLSSLLPQGGTFEQYQACTITQTASVPFIPMDNSFYVSDNFVTQAGCAMFEIPYTEPDVKPVGYIVYTQDTNIIVGVGPLPGRCVLSYRTNPNYLPLTLSAHQYIVGG